MKASTKYTGYAEKRAEMKDVLDEMAEKGLRKTTETVDHPAHYKAEGGIEVIDVIEQFHLGFSLGNAVKYVLRAGRKDTAKYSEDLRKAKWYIERELAHLE